MSRGIVAVNNIREILEWECVLLLVWYCCDVPEAKDMRAGRHGVALKDAVLDLRGPERVLSVLRGLVRSRKSYRNEKSLITSNFKK